jgi:hypothetical protein
MNKVVTFKEFVEDIKEQREFKKREKDRVKLIAEIRNNISNTKDIANKASVLTVMHKSGWSVLLKNRYGDLNFFDVPIHIRYEIFNTYEEWLEDYNVEHVCISYKMLNKRGQELLDGYMKKYGNGSVFA